MSRLPQRRPHDMPIATIIAIIEMLPQLISAGVQIAGHTVKGQVRALTAQPEGRALLDVALPRVPGSYAGQPDSILLH